MKDIKTFIIGFLTCACLFLIMGQTQNSGIAKFDTISARKIIVTENHDCDNAIECMFTKSIYMEARHGIDVNSSEYSVYINDNSIVGSKLHKNHMIEDKLHAWELSTLTDGSGGIYIYDSNDKATFPRQAGFSKPLLFRAP